MLVFPASIVQLSLCCSAASFSHAGGGHSPLLFLPSCLFILCSSVTPPAQNNSAKSSKNNPIVEDRESSTIAAATITTSQSGRRASSTDQLATKPNVPENSLLTSNRSASGNHLPNSASVETVCGNDQTQTNIGSKFAPRPDVFVQPAIEIDSPQMDLAIPFSASNHPISLDDIDQIDMDNLRLEDECRALEAQALFWEQKIEDLERKQFADDVPRTLVDSIIKHRRELRDLEYQLYRITLDSEESDTFSYEGKMSQTMNWLDEISPSDQSPVLMVDPQVCYMNDASCVNNRASELDDLNVAGIKISNKFGSHLKPGQENTANVLDAVPPPRSLQHRQYLNKASSGTDSSEYSQLPSYNQHSHKIVRHHQVAHGDEHSMEEDTRNSHGFHRHQHQHHQHHHHRQRHHQQKRISRREVQPQQLSQQQKSQQLYVQLERTESGDLQSPSRQRASPIRPNHFKCQFRSPHVIAQDSSSTTSPSSSSPQ